MKDTMTTTLLLTQCYKHTYHNIWFGDKKFNHICFGIIGGGGKMGVNERAPKRGSAGSAPTTLRKTHVLAEGCLINDRKLHIQRIHHTNIKSVADNIK